jgi:hypothetical protein
MSWVIAAYGVVTVAVAAYLLRLRAERRKLGR